MPGPGYPVVNKTDQVPVQWSVQFTEGNQHQTNRQVGISLQIVIKAMNENPNQMVS